jgi:hypothetical protein
METILAIETAIGDCTNFAEFIELVADYCEKQTTSSDDVCDEVLSRIWAIRAQYLRNMSDSVVDEIVS